MQERGEGPEASRAADPKKSLESNYFGSSWKSVTARSSLTNYAANAHFARSIVPHFNPILQSGRKGLMLQLRLMNGRREFNRSDLVNDHTIKVQTTAIRVVAISIILDAGK